jgi:hypothetical protein
MRNFADLGDAGTRSAKKLGTFLPRTAQRSENAIAKNLAAGGANGAAAWRRHIRRLAAYGLKSFFSYAIPI